MSIQLPREFYIPSGAVKVTDKESGAVVYAYRTPEGAPAAVGFFGKSAKPSFRYRYTSDRHREERVQAFFESCRGWTRRKTEQAAERKAKLAKPHSLQVGHVLVSSWGYEQTNVDWFQVTRLVGKRSVELREIGGVSEGTAWAQGRTVPAIDQFKGEAFLRRVNESGGVRICDVRRASLWDGRVMNWTAYH